MINGTLSTQSLTQPSKGLTATAFFTCVEHAEAGQFSVPSFVLFGLPVGLQYRSWRADRFPRRELALRLYP